MNKINKVVTAIILTGSVFFTSCKEGTKNDQKDSMQKEMHEGGPGDHAMVEENHKHADSHAASEGQSSEGEITVKFKDEQVAALYEHYINIKTALVSSNNQMAKSSAEEFLAVTKPDTEAKVIKAAKEIASSNNVEEQRIAFSQLSEAIEGHLRDAIVSGTIYKQYCPMAFKNTGDSWFANTKKIRNPYFGEKMLNCGRVEGILN